MKKVLVKWDTDGIKVALPKIAEVPMGVPDDDVADWLSDAYGWCVNSWNYV